jgi:ribosomal protein RSM22 (predicted rRNA methylase)
MRHWTRRELEVLAGLRRRFLERTAGAQDYWRSDEELRLYDETFAARIGWKIDAVIRDLQRLGWEPKARRLFDWGCGTGIAARRVLAAFPGIAEVAVYDRSARAMRFARERIGAEFPGVAFVDGAPPVDRETLLVVSHVISELDAKLRGQLLALADAAGEVLWVEAGTHADSRQLGAIRDELLAKGIGFRAVSPCTHSAQCPMFAVGNVKHWCHRFAEAPEKVSRDARWDEWSRELGIDRRSLPYAHVVLSRHEVAATEGYSRIIGMPREGKGHSKILACDAEGLRELMLQKRDAPELYKTLGKTSEHPAYRWRIVEGKIVGVVGEG